MRFSERVTSSLMVLACLGILAVPAHAQFRAGIQGTVTDSTGALVKGVTITVTSQETGRVLEAVSNEQGLYSVLSLAPGFYTVSTSLTGFKTKTLKDVRVGAETVAGLNLRIEPGIVTETVVVNGDTLPVLQTEDASLKGTITSAQIKTLPGFRGDPFELLRLTPGVFGLGARDSGGNSSNFPGNNTQSGSNSGVFQIENAVPVSANGSRVESNGYQLDGISTNSQSWAGATVLTPNTESVKEITVEVTPYSAENSHGAGAIVEIVSQNGTNDIHGSAVFRTQSPGLNAFQRWGGPNGATPQRNNQLLHSYLGSLGGPIIKNKLFAFFSFEHPTSSGSVTSRASRWYETSSWVGRLLAGSIGARIFAVPGSAVVGNPKILTSTCATLGLAEDTTSTGHVNGLPGTCQTVAGGVDLGSNVPGGGFIRNDPCPPLPASCINFATYSTGGGLDGLPDVALVEYDNNGDKSSITQYNGRVDYNVTQKDLVAFSLFYVPEKNSSGGWFGGRQYDVAHGGSTRYTVALLWTRTINSTTINEARTNVARWYFNEFQSNAKAPFGVPNVGIRAGAHNGSELGQTLQNIEAGYPLGPGALAQTTYTFRDTLSKVHGTHVLKFGGEITKEQNNAILGWNARPSYDFNNLWSFANDAPNDGGSGNYDPKTGFPTSFPQYTRVSVYSFFGQDTWKVKPNLTLTMGLRYDYFSPYGDKFGRLSNILPATGASTLTAAKIKQGGDYVNPDRNNFGPQLGFAWSPRSVIGYELNNKFVLRGGIGVAYNRVPESLLFGAVFNPPFVLTTNFGQDGPGKCLLNVAVCPARNQLVYAFSSGGNNSLTGFPANPAAIQTFDPNTGLPQPTSNSFAPTNISGAVRNLATPYTWHYSIGGQYDLWRNWVASLSYQGSQSRKDPRIVNYGQFFARPTAPNPFTTPPNQSVNLIGDVNLIQTDVNSHYNGLLAGVTHRSSSSLPLELGANYRYGKTVDDCSGQFCSPTYPFNLRTETGPANFDVTHTFTANALYELPLFKSRHDWLYTLAGGWKLGGILTLNSGFPWTPISNVCQSFNGFDTVCTVRPAAFLGGAGSDFSTGTFQKLGGNFPAKTAANANSPGLDYFTPAAASTVGLPPVPGVGRNSFRGPRYTGFDVSFGKRFTLPKMRVFGEDVGFEFKFNAFNIFNKLNLKPFQFGDDNTKIDNVNFGRASGALSGRVLEFTGRISF